MLRYCAGRCSVRVVAIYCGSEGTGQVLRPGVLLPQVLYQQRHPQNRFYCHWYLCVGSLRKESCSPCRAAFALVLWLKTGGLAGFALGSNMVAICSNTTVYVAVTVFALCGPVAVLAGFEATKFLSATGVGLLIAVASGTFLCCALPDLLMPALQFHGTVSMTSRCSGRLWSRARSTLLDIDCAQSSSGSVAPFMDGMKVDNDRLGQLRGLGRHESRQQWTWPAQRAWTA